jgi:hypothetical protein
MSGDLMKAIDVLRDEGTQLASLFQNSKRACPAFGWACQAGCSTRPRQDNFRTSGSVM